MYFKYIICVRGVKNLFLVSWVDFCVCVLINIIIASCFRFIVGALISGKLTKLIIMAGQVYNTCKPGKTKKRYYNMCKKVILPLVIFLFVLSLVSDLLLRTRLWYFYNRLLFTVGVFFFLFLFFFIIMSQ